MGQFWQPDEELLAHMKRLLQEVMQLYWGKVFGKDTPVNDQEIFSISITEPV